MSDDEGRPPESPPIGGGSENAPRELLSSSSASRSESNPAPLELSYSSPFASRSESNSAPRELLSSSSASRSESNPAPLELSYSSPFATRSESNSAPRELLSSSASRSESNSAPRELLSSSASRSEISASAKPRTIPGLDGLTNTNSRISGKNQLVRKKTIAELLEEKQARKAQETQNQQIPTTEEAASKRKASTEPHATSSHHDPITDMDVRMADDDDVASVDNPVPERQKTGAELGREWFENVYMNKKAKIEGLMAGTKLSTQQPAREEPAVDHPQIQDEVTGQLRKKTQAQYFCGTNQDILCHQDPNAVCANVRKIAAMNVAFRSLSLITHANANTALLRMMSTIRGDNHQSRFTVEPYFVWGDSGLASFRLRVRNQANPNIRINDRDSKTFDECIFAYDAGVKVKGTPSIESFLYAVIDTKQNLEQAIKLFCNLAEKYKAQGFQFDTADLKVMHNNFQPDRYAIISLFLNRGKYMPGESAALKTIEEMIAPNVANYRDFRKVFNAIAYAPSLEYRAFVDLDGLTLEPVWDHLTKAQAFKQCAEIFEQQATSRQEPYAAIQLPRKDGKMRMEDKEIEQGEVSDEDVADLPVDELFELTNQQATSREEMVRKSKGVNGFVVDQRG